MKLDMFAKICLKELRDNAALSNEMRIKAGNLLTDFRHHPNDRVTAQIVHIFLRTYSSSFVQWSLNRMTQRNLDGHHLWISDIGRCLTVRRGPMSTPVFESIEGDWTDKEKEIALYLFQFTDAAKR